MNNKLEIKNNIIEKNKEYIDSEIKYALFNDVLTISGIVNTASTEFLKTFFKEMASHDFNIAYMDQAAIPKFERQLKKPKGSCQKLQLMYKEYIGKLVERIPARLIY
jgi:hypothetical protein